MGSEIDLIKAKEVEQNDGEVLAKPNESALQVQQAVFPLKDRASDERLEVRLAEARLEAIEALKAHEAIKPTVYAAADADRIHFLVKKLGGSFKSGRNQAEANLESELKSSPQAVTAYLKAGQSADDPNVREACNRLLRRTVIRTESPLTSVKIKVAKQTAIDELLNGRTELGQFQGPKAGDPHENVVSVDTKPLIEQSRQFSIRAGRCGFASSDDNDFQQLIRTADQLSIQSARDKREEDLRNAARVITTSTEVTPFINKAIEELKSPQWISAKVRLNYAEALMAGGETAKAQKNLIEAMRKDKRIVHDKAFQQTFISVGGRYNKVVADTFSDAGGTDRMLKDAERDRYRMERNSALLRTGNDDSMFVVDVNISVDGVRGRDSKERAELMDSWAKVLCGVNGAAEGQALLLRLRPILADPQLSNELMPALSKRLESCFVSGGQADCEPALSVLAVLTNPGDPKAVGLLVRAAGGRISPDDPASIPYPRDYISNGLLANVYTDEPPVFPPTELQDPTVSTQASRLLDFAGKQPTRQASKLSPEEALKVVAKEATAGQGDSLHFLMTMTSDIWLRDKSATDSQWKQDPSPIYRLLAEMSRDPSHKAALVDAFFSMSKQRPSSEIPPKLFGIVLKVATGVESDKPRTTIATLNALEEQARTGDNRSMGLLCFAAAGAGGQSALFATRNLRNLCDTPRRSREVLSAMLDAYRSSKDSGFLLETMGKIASSMPVVPADVRDAITDAFRLSADRGSSIYKMLSAGGTVFQQSTESAVNGYMEINPPAKWDTATINVISANPSHVLTSWLKTNIASIPADQGRELTNSFVEHLCHVTDRREKQCSAQAYGSALAALAPFAAKDDITRLIGSPGYQSHEGRFAIGQTVLHHYDAGSASMKEKVIDTLIDTCWSEVLQNDVAVRVADQIINSNSSLDRLDKMFASVRNIDLPLPVAVQLKRLGVHPEYSDEQLIKLADDMVAKHGFESVNFTVASAFAYNSASPRVQGLLRSEGALRLGIDGHVLSASRQTGGQLDMSALVDALASARESEDRKLLQRLPVRLAELKTFSTRELERMTNTYADVMHSREKKINHIKLVHGGEKGIPDVQTKLTEQLHVYNTRAQNLGRNIQGLAEDADSINISLLAHRHSLLVSFGHTHKAHDLSLTAISDSAAHLPQPLVEQFRRCGAWRSQVLEGNLSAGQIGRLLTSERKYYDAFGILHDYRPAFCKFSETNTDSVHSQDRAALIERAVLGQAYKSILNSSSLQRLTETGKQFGPYMHLGDSVRQLMNGRASDSTAKYLHGQLQDMKKVLDEVKPEDIQDTRRVIADLQKLAQDKSVDDSVKNFAKEFSLELSKLVEVLDPGSKTGKDLRVLCNVKEEQLREATFWENVGAALVYTLVAVATAAAVVCTMGGSLPVVLLVLPTTCFVSKEVTAEALHSAGYGEGSIMGAYARGKVVIDKKTGQLTMQTSGECIEAVALSYAEDLAFNGVALTASKLGAFTRRVTGLGKTETLKASRDQSSEIFKRIGAEPLGPAAKYRREFSRQLGPGMAMTGSEVTASEIGTGEKYAGLGVAFLHALGSKGRLPKTIRFHGEPEVVYSKLDSRGMLERSPEGNVLRIGKEQVKLEPIPGFEKSATKPAQAFVPDNILINADGHHSNARASQSAEARVATDVYQLRFEQLMQPLWEANAAGIPLKGVECQAVLARVATEVLVPYAKQTAQKLGIPQEVINDQNVVLKALRTMDGRYGSESNIIEIGTSAKNVRRAIDHELKHMSDAIKVTAAYHVDPQAVTAQVREQCLRDVGRTGDRVDSSRRFSVDAQTGQEMRTLVRRAMEHFPHETVPDLKTVIDWLTKQNVSDNLLKVHRNQAVLATEVRSEFQNFSNTIRDNIIAKDAIERNTELRKHLEKIESRYERWRQERGSLASNYEFQKQLGTLARDLIGRRDGEVYQVAGDEIRARRLDTAQEYNRYLQEGKVRLLQPEVRAKTTETRNFLEEIKYGVVSETVLKDFDAAATTTGAQSEAHFQQAQQHARKLLAMSSPENLADHRAIAFLRKAGLLTPEELRAANFVPETSGFAVTPPAYDPDVALSTLNAVADVAQNVKAGTVQCGNLEPGVTNRTTGETEYTLKTPVAIDPRTADEITVLSIHQKDGKYSLTVQDREGKLVKRNEDHFAMVFDRLHEELPGLRSKMRADDYAKVLGSYLDTRGVPTRLPQQMWPFGRRAVPDIKSESQETAESKQLHERNWRQSIAELVEGRNAKLSGMLSSRSLTYEGNRETFLKALEDRGYVICMDNVVRIGNVVRFDDVVVINDKPIKLIQRTEPTVEVLRVSDSKGNDVAITALNLSESSSLTIGRGANPSIALSAHSISRSHGRIGSDDRGVHFEQLTDRTGAARGTWIRKVDGGALESVLQGQRIYLHEVAELWIGGQPEVGNARRLHLSKEYNLDKAPMSPSRAAEGELLKQGELSGVQRYTGKRGIMASLYEGTLTLPTGEELRVIIHTGAKTESVARMRIELAAQQLHKLLGFDSGFPETASRLVVIDGKLRQGWVQAHCGHPMEWVMSALALQREGGDRTADLGKVMDKDPHIRSQLEQAFVERMILGDSDPHSLNFVVEMQGPNLKKISNIDVEYAFPQGLKHHLPKWHYDHPGLGINGSLFEAMSNTPLSAQVKTKLANFVQKYDSASGRTELAKLGLTAAQVEGVIQRARWFHDNGKLPSISQ